MSKILVVLCMLFAVGAQADQGTGIKVEKTNPFTAEVVVPRDSTDFTVTQVKRTTVYLQETKDYTTCDWSSADGPSPETCPTITYQNPTLAIEIDYSYNAPSTAEGQEDGTPYNEDFFYLDPSTLTSPQLAEIPAKGALKGKAAQAVAQVTTHSASEPVQVVDWANSKICDTEVVGDGTVVKVDPNCQDQYVYKTVQKTFLFADGSLK